MKNHNVSPSLIAFVLARSIHYALVAVLLAHDIHYTPPDAMIYKVHVHIDHSRTPTPMGRPNAWITSTSTSATTSDVISLPWRGDS